MISLDEVRDIGAGRDAEALGGGEGGRVGRLRHAFGPAQQFAARMEQLDEDLGAFGMDGIDQLRKGGMQRRRSPSGDSSV